MAKYANGKYQILNPSKYIGNKQPTYRSSWEFTFCAFCDNNPAVLQWASEPMHIPYRNPFTNKQTIYVPDFLIAYMDRNDQKHVELIEIKPRNQVTLENARGIRDRAAVVLNTAKWTAARAWCSMNGIKFRIVTESDIYLGIKRTR